MYTPSSFREQDPAVLHEFMGRHSFATLFSETAEGPRATHLPFALDPERGANGTLISHMARANPHWRALEGQGEVLVSFLGPHAYISPSWYADPVTVPTWNYAAVHAYGAARIVQDPDVLRGQVLHLARLHESYVDPPWDVRHAEELLPTLLRAIVGIEIPIRRLEGKFKFNQNLSREDRSGVIAALEQAQDATGRDVAAIMRRQLE